MLDKIKNTNQNLKNFRIKGLIKAVSISEEKGTKKRNVELVELKKDFGIIGDAHAGGERQVSILAVESIDKMRKKGLKVNPGDFAENITTEGIDLLSLEVGMKLKVGKEALLEVSQIGKECHSPCNIYYQAGDCVMPREGIFARVLKGGIVKQGDRVEAENGTSNLKIPNSKQTQPQNHNF
jgi:MOSC domain-containing protein YiiM